jgi:uncharacterized protein (DUF433 family)
MLSNGMSADEIVEDFPELEKEDISAVLAFAADREVVARFPDGAVKINNFAALN